MSMILAIQYGLMLNLSGEVAQVQEEMGHMWHPGRFFNSEKGAMQR
jgi:hypothetical protein